MSPTFLGSSDTEPCFDAAAITLWWLAGNGGISAFETRMLFWLPGLRNDFVGSDGFVPSIDERVGDANEVVSSGARAMRCLVDGVGEAGPRLLSLMRLSILSAESSVCEAWDE